MTGSTIVDAVLQNAELARTTSRVLADLSLSPDRYIVMTAHHEETVVITRGEPLVLTSV